VVLSAQRPARQREQARLVIEWLRLRLRPVAGKAVSSVRVQRVGSRRRVRWSRWHISSPDLFATCRASLALVQIACTTRHDQSRATARRSRVIDQGEKWRSSPKVFQFVPTTKAASTYRVDEMRKSAKARTFAESRCRDG
jgi:hypothetical protein